MNSTVSFTQRIDAGLPVRVRVAVTAPATAGAAAGRAAARNPFGAASAHMNTAWLGGTADSGCANPAYVTKRITTGRLCGVLT